MMQIGNRQVTKIITGGRTIWEKPSWRELSLLDDRMSGEVRFMVINDMLLFDGQITFSNFGIFTPIFNLPDLVATPIFFEGDQANLAETKLASDGTLPIALFTLEMVGKQILGKCVNAQQGMRVLNLNHFRMKLVKN